MSASLPLIHVRKKDGEVQEVLVGSSAVTMVLGIIVVVAAAVLLATGAIRLTELVPLLLDVAMRMRAI